MSKISTEGMLGVKMDYEPRMVEYYRHIFKDEDRKVYYFADTTMQRIENMDLSKVESSDLCSICRKEGESAGIVLTSPNHRRLCFGFVIRPNHIILSAYRSNNSSRHSDFPDAVMMSQLIGNIVISEDGLTFNPATTLTGFLKMLMGAAPKQWAKDFFDRHYDLPILKKIQREIVQHPELFKADEKGVIHWSIELMRSLAENSCAPTLRTEAANYLYKYDILIKVLKMFVFLKTASVIEQTYISDDSPAKSYERNKRVVRNYVLVDSTWDGDITVLNPFSVRGHFRHQPKKDDKGEWYRQLIYVDSYMKQGYHRRAQKIIEQGKVEL